MVAKKTTAQVDTPKTVKQLQDELVTKRRDLAEAKRGHKLGELANPRVLATTRKEIARIKTAIKADQTGEEK